MLMACASLCWYRKSLPAMLPDFRTKATSKEHYLFKVQTEEQLRQAALEAGEDPGKLGGAPSRSLTLRPDEVPEENHMESLVLEGEDVVEIRQASKTSGCSTIPNASHASSGEDESGRPGRAGSKQSVGKKKGRSQSKLSRAGSKTSTRPDPHLQRSRSLSEGQLHISKQVSAGQTLGDQLAFRGDDTWTSTHSQIFGSSLMPPGVVPDNPKEAPRRQGSKGSNRSRSRPLH
eukprot:symbB.v1.2.026161.t1/scaffold2491.1/size77855/2